MAGPYAAVLADLCRVQIRRLRQQPTPRQLRKARSSLEGMIGKAPMSRLRPLFKTLRQLEDSR